jgi:hypothetical protein
VTGNSSFARLHVRSGVTDAHLSQVIRQVNYETPSPDLTRRVALALGLPSDYFPEFGEGFIIQRVKRDARLREELYDRLHEQPRNA